MPLIDLVDINLGHGAGTSMSGSRGAWTWSQVWKQNFGVTSPNKRKSLGRSGIIRGKKWDIIQG